MHLWDTEGRRYLDFFGGVAVNAVGHCHEKVVAAIAAQASRLMHVSNHYYIEGQALLAERLCAITSMGRAFIGNSGAEANEAAFKLARMYWHKKGRPERNEIISLRGSFHGRTMSTLAATGQDAFHAPFKSLIRGYHYCPINDADAFGSMASSNPNVAAAIVEPVQGEGGVHPLEDGYLKKVRGICDEAGILLIFDEIQTGMGRTGRMLGHEHYGVKPDVVTLAKALGGGFPIGAMCATEEAATGFGPGDHGTTYGGGPLACAAALAVIDVIVGEGLVANSAAMGSYLIAELNRALAGSPGVTAIRGLGLMVGIELAERDSSDVVASMLKRGYVVGKAGSRVTRLLPPLIVTRREIDGLVGALAEELG